VVLLMGGSKSSNGAKDVADKFFKADVAKNLDGMKDLACGSLKGQLNDASKFGGFPFHKSYKLGKVTKQGDAASDVAVTLVSQDGSSRDFTARVQKNEGTLKVCEVTAGSSSSQGGDTAAAEDTVRKLLEAAKNRDLSTAQSLTCEPLHSRVESFPSITSYEVGSGGVSGDSGEISFTVTSEGDTNSEVAELSKQGGSWKVCDFHSANDSSDSNGPEPTDTDSSSPDFPTDSSAAGTDESSPTGSFCVTPSGSTPICIPD